MSKRVSIISIILFFTLVFVVCIIQRHNIDQLKYGLLKNQEEKVILGDYVKLSFDSYASEVEQDVLDEIEPELSDTTICMYLPSSLCRSCFTSLLFALQDKHISWQRIKVLCEFDDYEIRSECIARDIDFNVLGHAIEGVTDIIISRKYKGFLPISMKYNLNRDYILTLFLSDEDRH